MLRRGDILENRYRIDDLIDEGGMSKVWRATDLYINATWAVKEIDKHKKEFRDIMDDYGRIPEFDYLKTLNHPAFPRIVHTIDEPGALYIIMDYIEGENLLKILDLYGRPQEEDVAAWMIEACDAIDYLHQNGIIHRDIKPSNMMVDKQGNLKIIDMGSACAPGQTDKPLGTYGYASPEHYKCVVDERSDVYTVGMTMYQLLTGIDPTEKAFKKQSLRDIDKSISSGLVKIVDKAASGDPEERYPNCKVLADTLYSYKKLEDEYIYGLKNALKKRVIALLVGLIGIITSMAIIFLGISKEQKTYESLLTSETGDKVKRIAELEEASNLKPKEAAPYIEMIKVYAEDGLFTEDELAALTKVYQSHKEKLQRDEQAFSNVNYEIGESILTYYTGETDNSNRAKLLAALPYFENAKAEGFENEALAAGYSFMGRYYKDYVLADTSLVLKSVTKEEYGELLNNLRGLIGKLNSYGGDPQGKMKLITYDIILSLMDSQREGFAKSGIAKEDLTSVIEILIGDINEISSVDQTIKTMQKELLENIKDIQEKIDMTYLREARNA